MLLKITILCMLYIIIYLSFFWPIVVIKREDFAAFCGDNA